MSNMDIVTCDKEGINHVVKSYKSGEIIAFPTDTVYGIGCNPFNKESITKIYELKKRDGKKRFPILGFSKTELKNIVDFSLDAEKISQKFWPGQVTILLPIKEKIIEKIDNDGKLAVRVPDNKCTLAILKQCKLIIGTSANITGEESILDASEFKTRLPKVDVLMDGGRISSSGESTIIDFVDDELKIIREGSISKDEIRNVL